MSEPVDPPDDDDLLIPMNSVPSVLHEGESSGVFVGLLDVRFRKINAVRMAPLAYVAVTVLAGAGCILLDIVAFRHSTTVGIITSFLITPALFVTLVILARFVLEFMLSLLVLPSHLTQVTNSVLGILGTTTTIVGTTTDISSDTAHLGIMHPLKKIRLSKRKRIVPY